MHDRTLIAIALCASAAGLIALIIAFAKIEPDERQLGEITDGEMTRIRGTIASVSTRGEVTVLSLSTTAEAVLFEPVADLSEGDCVLVSGERSTFDGRPQLVVAKIARCEGNT